MRKKRQTPRGHRLREGATPKKVARRWNTRKILFTVTISSVAGVVLVICIRVGVHDGVLHHLALAVLAERLAFGMDVTED